MTTIENTLFADVGRDRLAGRWISATAKDHMVLLPIQRSYRQIYQYDSD